jgi:hypothetical protein
VYGLLKGKTGMNPGRELDALIAEKVMGLEVSFTIYPPEGADGYEIQKIGGDCFDGCTKLHWSSMPEYSTDIAAAWEVVEKVRTKKISVSLVTCWDDSKDMMQWVCKIEWGGTDRFEFALQDTAPHAICLAALKTMGIDLLKKSV